MNKYLLIASFVCIVGLFGCSKFDPTEGDQQGQALSGSPASRGAMMAAYQGTDNAKEGVVIVKFKRGYEPSTITMGSDGVLRTGVMMVDQVNSKVRAYRMERVFPYAEKFEKKRRRHGLDLWYRLSYDVSQVSLAQAASDYSQIEQLEWVETARYGKLIGDEGGFEAVESGPRASVLPSQAASVPFNDPMIGDQWWIDSKTTTVEGVHPDASINMFPAWQKVRGSKQVIVCVVDGCVKWDHADLAANMWANPGEIPGNFIDDDGNGCIDDVWGFDFSQKDDIIEYAPHDHGTHVAGIVAAVNNNGIGVCGVAGGSGYGDGARIMSCQIFNKTMSTYEQMAAAIEYGANMGAVISQNSWGFSNPAERSEVIRQAIEYFVAEAGDPELFPNTPMRGGLVMFAAGNLAHDIGEQKLYPQAYEGAIAVAATDHKRQRSGFSCYGDWVEISAPGGSDGQSDADIKHHIKSTYAGKNSNYGYFPGTSQACPMVSGVAALLIQANPGKTNAQIKELLFSSVASLESTEPNFAKMGSGLLDASKHLSASNDNQGPKAVSDLSTVDDVANNAYTLDWTVPADPSGDYIATYTLYYSESAITQANMASCSSHLIKEHSGQPAGDTISYHIGNVAGVDIKRQYYFAITSTDQWGNVSAISNVIRYDRTNDNAGAKAISDLLVVEDVAKRTFTLQWSVPQDQVGDWVKSYTLYYSQDGALKADNLWKAQSVTFEEFSALVPGQRIAVRVDKLPSFNQVKDYYMVVTSTDRWGNVSPVSNNAVYVTADKIILLNPLVGAELAFAVGRDHKVLDKVIMVYDRGGRIVVKRELKADAAADKIVVNVAGLAAGSYTYNVQTDGETALSGSFRKL